MIDCFYITNIPDIENRPLKSYLFTYFGVCKIDIFRKRGMGTHNSGSCRIFLQRELARELKLFCLTPFACKKLDGIFKATIFIQRWRKNESGLSNNLNRDFASISYENKSYEDDYKTEEILIYEDELNSGFEIISKLHEENIIENTKLNEEFEIMKNDLIITCDVCESVINFLWNHSNGHKQRVINIDSWKNMILAKLNNLNCKNYFERTNIFRN